MSVYFRRHQGEPDLGLAAHAGYIFARTTDTRQRKYYENMTTDQRIERILDCAFQPVPQKCKVSKSIWRQVEI